MVYLPKESLEVGHIYKMSRYNDTIVAVWDGKKFLCPIEPNQDRVTELRHYDDGYPTGVVKPLSQLTIRPIQIGGINSNTIRTLLALNNLATEMENEAQSE